MSVRSGILDFIVKTNVNMFVLYSGEKIKPAGCSLVAWRCKGKIKELDSFEFLQDESFRLFREFVHDITHKNGGREQSK